MAEASQPVKLDDMIGHDDLLERYTWLSAKMLNKWRVSRSIRYFHGSKGKVLYPLQDIEAAVNAELRIDVPPMIAAKPAPAGPDSPEAIEIRERLFLRKLKGRRVSVR